MTKVESSDPNVVTLDVTGASGQAENIVEFKTSDGTVQFSVDKDGVVYPAGGKTASFIVAASDTPDALKGGADYVCDGTDDQDDIMAAIAALPSTGGEVVLLQGTYNLDEYAANEYFIRIAKSYVTLRGVGNATVLKPIANSQGTGTHEGIVQIGDGNAYYYGIVVRDLMIDGNKANQTNGIEGAINFYRTCPYCKVINCYIKDFKGHANGGGIHALSTTDCQIFDNILSGTEYRGIVLDSSYDMIVRGNRIIGVKTSGILMAGALRCVITENVCSGATDEHGIYASDGSQNTISNNVCHDNHYTGIHLRQGGSTVCGNVCYNNGTYGILAEEDQLGTELLNSVIIGNTCYGNGADGIKCAEGTRFNVEGNVSVYNAGIGVNMHRPDTVCVIGNLCLNNDGGGVRVYSSDATVNYANIIANNICYDDQTTATAAYGMFCSRLTNCIISGNVCSNNRLTTSYGISMSACNDNILMGNSCIGNTLYGIQLSGSDGNLLIGNKCKSNDYGLTLNATCDSCVVRENDLSGNTTGAIYESGTTSVIHNNLGYVTEASGVGTISSSGTSVVITHGLSSTPTKIFVTGSEAETSAPWVDTIGATTFTINVGAGVSGDRTVYWRAEV